MSWAQATCINWGTPSVLGPEEEDDLENMKQVYNEVPPFQYACQAPNALKDRPQTGLFKRSVPMEDSRGRKSRTFLERVRDKVLRKIEENKNMLGNLSYCLQTKDARCKELQEWSQKDLPKYVKDARFHLSLGQSEHQVKTWVGAVSQDPNQNLDSLGTPKMKKWDELSSHELSTANKALSYYKSKIKKDFPGANQEKQNEILMGYRYEHFETYRRMMAEIPLLQYIQSESVTPKEILASVQKVQENSRRENSMLSELSAALKKNPLPPQVLDLLNYSSFVEEVLMESPEYCGLATSLMYTRENRQIGNMIGLALPVLAISMLAPPLVIAAGGSAALGTGVAVGFGLTTGAGFAYQSQMALDDQRARSFSQLYGDRNAAGEVDKTSLEQVRMAEKSRDFQVLTLPLAFGGIGAFRSVAVKVGGMASKAKIFTRAAVESQK